MYVFTSTVLIKYPQVHLELTCSGTILIKTACRKVTWDTIVAEQDKYNQTYIMLEYIN